MKEHLRFALKLAIGLMVLNFILAALATFFAPAAILSTLVFNPFSLFRSVIPASAASGQ